MSAGKPARKSVTSAQISSFRVINPSSSFWRKSCNFLKAAAKEISAISSAARQNSGPAERRSLSSRMPTARNRYPCTNTSAPENGNGSCCSFSPWQPHPVPVPSWSGSPSVRKTSCRTAHNSPGFRLSLRQKSALELPQLPFSWQISELLHHWSLAQHHSFR